ncbi:RNA polymerase sigma factor (sigma-70 family) [Streptomyces sp. SAI-144]|uniref:sigma-70 family RNA polymerase sigma factor n=1 Tax=Streptomyces sp. SAI-144 TaxID=2940544 RepID=UPI002476E0D3|nr:sigma-70 family RNA polymerase sigma factor [Streptomyces sp. SAI-144]MDH6434676.1 RNA polymerase sigma factor (sigma-70 family) [Streptomyces sp. SAI-144]
MTDQPARVPAQASPSATAAYVRIYEEEQPRLVAYARSLTRNTWAAEDLVAEAHFRVWRRLSAGHEIDNVPAYLMTTVRHLASSVASATHETPRDPQIPEQAPAGHVDDPAEQVSSTDLLVRVLGELPERWVQALWLADAEGQPLETVGRQIGAKQGATAVLLHRAREGMRQAFLRSQTEAPDDPACEVHWVRMPAYVRGNATPRQSERLLAHVESCDGCRGRLAVLIRANDRLPALVGPALLVFVVGGGTGKFLASLTAGSAGAASVTGQGAGQGLLHTARAAGPKAKAALASGTAAAAAIAVVLALGVNDSPATVTSPGKVPVAQGPVTQAPVTGPSAGAAEETPGSAARQVERDRDRDRTRGDGVGAVVTVDVGGTVNSGDSGSGSGDSAGSGSSGSSDGGGAEGDPTAPEQPAPEVPDPGPSPVEPVPGDEEPKPPVAPEPTPTPPKEQQPKPEQPKPEQPKPGTPGEEPPVPEPSPPTPADPDPVGETPEPPTYSEPPTAPESPEPSDPSEPPAPETPEPPTTGDDCGRQPTPEPTRESTHGTSAPDKGVEPKHV